MTNHRERRCGGSFDRVACCARPAARRQSTRTRRLTRLADYERVLSKSFMQGTAPVSITGLMFACHPRSLGNHCLTHSRGRKDAVQWHTVSFMLVGYLASAIGAWILVKKPGRAGFLCFASGATLQLLGGLLQHFG